MGPLDPFVGVDQNIRGEVPHGEPFGRALFSNLIVDFSTRKGLKWKGRTNAQLEARAGEEENAVRLHVLPDGCSSLDQCQRVLQQSSSDAATCCHDAINNHYK
ncbi:hypothetical protein TNIN_150951 [Trichonephila inaurata madagascariensis]|uniref:Uncharacterized protein n=1 Tax=Trichonephila inaurata madagascariensis TaxID=2747483 RepID=A0A8X7CEY2_9ARAC|nr:hypothetical protein TNIN_150951 [Trichonephila inaurata madagascariensis]